MLRRALVLGAGGVAASAWQIGLIAGMAEAGADVRNAELLVGTLAGARVSVQLAREVALATLLARQIEPAKESAPDVDWSGGEASSRKRERAAALRPKSSGGSAHLP